MSKSVVLKHNIGFLSHLPVGSIIAWHRDFEGTPALPPGWVECNGQTLDDPDSPYHGKSIPNLNGEGRFLRGAGHSGEEQPQDWKSFTVAGHARGPYTHNDVLIPKEGYNTTYPFGGKWESVAMDGGYVANQLRLKFDDSEVRPVNMSVVWIMKVKQVTAAWPSQALQAEEQAPPGALYVSQAGNVGIGTPSPGAKLEVAGTVKASAFQGDGSGLTGISAGKWSDGPGGAIYFNNGNVGIGTTDPTQGTGYNFRMTVKGNNYRVADFKSSENGLAAIRISTANNSSRAHIGVFGHGTYITGRNQPGNSYDLVINDDGNVGIGTMTPTHNFHVKTGDAVGLFESTGSQAYLRLSHGEGFNRRVEFTNRPGGRASIWVSEAGDAFNVLRNGNVGIGTASPGYKLHTNGNSYAMRRYGGAIDYAEYFQSSTGKEIQAGTAIVLAGDKVRPAKKNEMPIGVISANPGIVGGAPAEWPKKYLSDPFGNMIMEEYEEEVMVPKKETVTRERQKVEKRTIEEEVTRMEVVKKGRKYIQQKITETVSREVEEPVFKEVNLYDEAGKNVIGKHRIPVMETYEEEVEVLDENGETVMVGTGEFVASERPKLNPDYDESKEYISREDRPEWNCVGLLGQLPLRKGQPVAPTWVKIKDISEKVELWLAK